MTLALLERELEAGGEEEVGFELGAVEVLVEGEADFDGEAGASFRMEEVEAGGEIDAGTATEARVGSGHDGDTEGVGDRDIGVLSADVSDTGDVGA